MLDAAGLKWLLSFCLQRDKTAAARDDLGQLRFTPRRNMDYHKYRRALVGRHCILVASRLRSHLVETQNHVARLKEIFGIVGVAPKGKPCKGMKGLIEEGSEAVQEEEKGALRDLAIIAGAQRVEHYEMSAYGTARTIAEQLDLNDAVKLLQQTEDEEKEADSKLTQVAMTLYESEEEQEEADNEEEMNSVGASRSNRGSSPKPATRKATH